uniref:RING-type domain-containing protein n=1 Tax=Acrobeloides nanus TaxID=290746 RepID=A0A914EJS5_9BILA
MEWVHCNCCFTLPSQNIKFYFTSCGHILCANCLKKDGTKTPKATESCRCCKKKANILEINRTLKPEIQMFFRNPKDLASQYMQNLKSVIDFQNHQRSRLMKYQQEQMSKAMKYVKAAQLEIKQRAEIERVVVAERNELKAELEKQTAHAHNLETLLADRERELYKYKHQKETSVTRTKNPFPFPKLNSISTPLNTLSFVGVATSTPVENAFSQPSNLRGDYFSNPDAGRNSPISTCGGPLLTTPAMLGIKKINTKRSTSAPKNSGGGFF